MLAPDEDELGDDDEDDEVVDGLETVVLEPVDVLVPYERDVDEEDPELSDEPPELAPESPPESAGRPLAAMLSSLVAPQVLQTYL